MGLSFDHRTLGQRVLFGTDAAADNVAAAVGDLGARRVLLIADAASHGVVDRILGRVPVAARIDEVVQHVPVEKGESAVRLAQESDADLVLTVGGGSATGLGKFVARDTALPLVAVPTTFAGSEATDVWGQTEGGRKVTGTDPRVLPRAVVYDASLSRSLPVGLATASGMNALAHAIDGFWAPRADPINRALGTEGIRVLVPGLRRLVADPDDLEAREQTLYGAYLAAVAFASAGSGMHHKICHTLGGAYNLSHAEMHAIVLPYVTAFVAPAAPDAADRVSQALGGAAAGPGLLALRAELGVPAGLRDLGMREDDIVEAAELALPAIPASTPRPVDLDDLTSLLRAAWAGAPLEEVTA